MRPAPAAASASAFVSPLLAAVQDGLPESAGAAAHARQFAHDLLVGEVLDTGEGCLAHADGVSLIVRSMGGAEAMCAAAYLVYACPHLLRPEELITRSFGAEFASLALETNKLVRVQRQARTVNASLREGADPKVQTENVRKMLLAFSRDLRVVVLRLASRLQTLRFFASAKCVVPDGIAREALQVFAPLANRLGIWQLKWEMEDLAFRFLEPDVYKDIARKLDEKRTEREVYMAQLCASVADALRAQGIAAEVAGRPKHIYSIVRKMRGKSLPFEQVFDIRAMRIIVPRLDDCYAALAWVYERFSPLADEFDDYVARPKANGYQSLHTVVRDEAGRPVEVQVRTRAMHDHAEHGVAAHWAYKEAGTKGYAGVSASSAYDAKIAVLRQLLAWERDLSEEAGGLFDDRIYVLTPDAAVIELPTGATPVDFAYTVHTTLGHRCRGARVDGAMAPLNTRLANGQTVEIVAIKEGGPSRDWLNLELGFLASARARAKVRAWFNEQQKAETASRGREAVERVLQREGRTALNLEELAGRLGFDCAAELFAVVGKDEYSLRHIEQLLRPSTAPEPDVDEAVRRRIKPSGAARGSGVLVVGVDSLLTQLARCCKPAPPDAIAGFVTRGKGVSIHRSSCRSFAELITRASDRVIEVAWGERSVPGAAYPVDVAVEAVDRQGLLRDISDVFARERMNVVGVQTSSVKGVAWMTFTVEIQEAARLAAVVTQVREVRGVRQARRR